jgi:hypothetical protein
MLSELDWPSIVLAGADGVVLNLRTSNYGSDHFHLEQLHTNVA